MWNLYPSCAIAADANNADIATVSTSFFTMASVPNDLEI
jgi:hypothetical protein